VKEATLGTLSGYQLTEEAEKRFGIKTNSKQLAEYEDAGVIPSRTDEGKWPESALGALVKANRLARVARPLYRRAILCFCSKHKSIQPDKLQSALVALAPKISAPVKKMGRVVGAVALYHRQTLHLDSVRPTPPRKWSKPSPSEWPQLLAGIEPDILWAWAEQMTHLDALLLGYTNPEFFQGAPEGVRVDDIPAEERLLLLIVWYEANRFRSSPA
jgi:hypothetical protein